MRAILALAAVAVLLALPASGQSADVGGLVQAGPNLLRLGPYFVWDDPTYAGALEKLGPSSGCRSTAANANFAVANWWNLGVRIQLATFGAQTAGETGCTAPQEIKIASIRITGKRWYTSRKLHVGDPVAKMHRLYPKALPPRANGWPVKGWWIVHRRGICFGDCATPTTTLPLLIAEVKNGRIAALYMHVGAQGE